jgi:hypothetical protein
VTFAIARGMQTKQPVLMDQFAAEPRPEGSPV